MGKQSFNDVQEVKSQILKMTPTFHFYQRFELLVIFSTVCQSPPLRQLNFALNEMKAFLKCRNVHSNKLAVSPAKNSNFMIADDIFFALKFTVDIDTCGGNDVFTRSVLSAKEILVDADLTLIVLKINLFLLFFSQSIAHNILIDVFMTGTLLLSSSMR